MSLLKIFNVYWSSETAGPSPDNNKRTEIFLSGCKKARNGNACKGCFNPDLWYEDYIAEVSPEDLLRQVKKFAPNKFITFVGGEPLDQFLPLAESLFLLKKNGYHIILFSHFLLEDIVKMKPKSTARKILDSIDILIDGEFQQEKCIYNDGNIGDGIFNVIGSGNQVVWDLSEKIDGKVEGLKSSDLVALYVTPQQKLKYITKDEFEILKCDIYGR